MPTLQELMAAKKAANAAKPPATIDLAPAAVDGAGADLALRQGASYDRRLLQFSQQLALVPKDKEVDLLNQVVDLITEILRMESANIGTVWNQSDRTKFDLPVLGEGLRLLRSRFNSYSPAICDQLLAAKNGRLLELSGGTDTRTVGHVIAAAAQVIAKQELESTTKKSTRAKREKRLTEAETLAASATDSAFDALFGDMDIFTDGAAENKDAANALTTNTAPGAGADADFDIVFDDDAFGDGDDDDPFAGL